MAGRGERRLNRLALQGSRRHDEPPFHSSYNQSWAERKRQWKAWKSAFLARGRHSR